MQHVFDAALDRVDQAERPAAFAGAVQGPHDVAHLVADQWLRAPIENGQQQTITAFAGWHGLAAIIDDLDDGFVLEQMLAAVWTLRRDGCVFSRAVGVEQAYVPSLLDATPSVGG